MTTVDIVQIAALLLLGLAALTPRSFVAMLLLGCAAAGALIYEGWHWTAALQAGLAGSLCLPALRLFAAGRLLVAGAVLVAVPALLVSHLGFGATWVRSALYAAVLLVLLPAGILRSLIRLKVLKVPAAPVRPASYAHFSSSAPSYPSRSEMRR